MNITPTTRKHTMSIQVEILMGLPGSGKTHYAKTHESKFNKIYTIILDELSSVQQYGKNTPLPILLSASVQRIKNYAHTIIIDGPFFTNEHIKCALQSIATMYDQIHVTIHHWNENRDYCLKNDGGRRDVPSTYTIMNAKYEQPDIQWLNAELKSLNVHVTEVVLHDVQLKPDWIRYWRSHIWLDDNKLYSESWRTGGCWRDCWGNSSYVSTEDPLPFTALDSLLEKVAFNLTFLQYQRIQEQCVTTETNYRADYYGGGITFCRWVCDLPKLYEMLHQYGYASA